MIDFQKLEREIKERGIVRQLNNGVTIFGERISGLGLNCGNIFINAGSFVEEDRDLGVMHFLEHMTIEGSKNYSDRELKTLATRWGINLNRHTNQNYLSFPVKGANNSGVILREYFPYAVSLIFDGVYNPLHNNEAIEKQRKIIQAERIEKEPSQHTLLIHYENIRRILYAANPIYLRPVIGTKETIDSIQRETLQRYHKKYFCGKNTLFSFIGDIDGDLENKVIANLENIPPGEVNSPYSFQEEIFTERPEFLVSPSEKEGYAGVQYIFKMPTTLAEDAQAVPFLLSLITAFPHGNLFNELREKRGLIYGSGLESNIVGHDATRYLIINFNVPQYHLNESLHVAENCFDQIRRGDFSEELIEAIKAQILPGQLYSYTQPGWIIEELSGRLYSQRFGKEISNLDLIKKFMAVTKEQVVNLAQKNLGENKITWIRR